MFAQRCIKCCEEFGAEDFEVPIENDGTLLLSTLQSVFPDAKGLLILPRSILPVGKSIIFHFIQV